MTNQSAMKWLLAAFAAMVLLAGACGSDDDIETTTTEVPAIADGDNGLPLADEDTQPLQDEGPCVEDEPDCEGMLSDAPEPQDLPDASSGGENSVSSSGMPVDGGLSIAEALASEAKGIVAVHGHLFDDGAGFRLCENLIGLGERYRCDGEQIEVTNIDTDAVTDIVFFEGTTYTEDEITLFGELTQGTLVLDPLVTG